MAVQIYSDVWFNTYIYYSCAVGIIQYFKVLPKPFILQSVSKIILTVKNNLQFYKQ